MLGKAIPRHTASTTPKTMQPRQRQEKPAIGTNPCKPQRPDDTKLNEEYSFQVCETQCYLDDSGILGRDLVQLGPKVSRGGNVISHKDDVIYKSCYI